MLPTNLKHSVLACSLLAALLASAGQAQAACTSNTRVTSVTTLSNLLGNKTVCFPSTTVDPMTWQEKTRSCRRGDDGSIDRFQTRTWPSS